MPPLTEPTDPGAEVFARLAEAVQDCAHWMPRGVADLCLAVPFHKPGLLGRQLITRPRLRGLRSLPVGKP